MLASGEPAVASNEPTLASDEPAVASGVALHAPRQDSLQIGWQCTGVPRAIPGALQGRHGAGNGSRVAMTPRAPGEPQTISRPRGRRCQVTARA